MPSSTPILRAFLGLTGLIITSLWVGCSPSSHQSKQGQHATTTYPTPDSMVGELPLYVTFEQISPIFEQETDTTYLINFWATWCKPCIEELPYFEALGAEHAGEKLKIILVSLDFPAQIESALIPFITKHQLQSQVLVLLDGKYNNWIDRVSPEWTGALPATYVYRGDAYQFRGTSFKDLAELQTFIDPFL